MHRCRVVGWLLASACAWAGAQDVSVVGALEGTGPSPASRPRPAYPPERAEDWPPSLDPAARAVRVARPETVVRAGVERTSAPVARLQPGVSGIAAPAPNGLARARFHLTGWVCSSEELVPAWSSGGRLTAASWLRVRAAPGREGKVLALVPAGTVLRARALTDARPPARLATSTPSGGSGWSGFQGGAADQAGGADVSDGEVVRPGPRGPERWVPVELVVQGYLPGAHLEHGAGEWATGR